MRIAQTPEICLTLPAAKIFCYIKQSLEIYSCFRSSRGDAGSVMASEQTYTITELAREFDVTPRAIRFYEDQGLLTPARSGRARVYSKADRTRLRLTLRGKRLGLSLAQIKELIDMYDGVHNSVPQLQRFLRVLAERRAALIQQREDIEAVLGEIDMLERQCAALLGDNVAGAALARAELDRHMRGTG
jgi:DNA-binding transcriptional MerR regulator